jgi:hypothetical protein
VKKFQIQPSGQQTTPAWSCISLKLAFAILNIPCFAWFWLNIFMKICNWMWMKSWIFTFMDEWTGLDFNSPFYQWQDVVLAGYWVLTWLSSGLLIFLDNRVLLIFQNLITYPDDLIIIQAG